MGINQKEAKMEKEKKAKALRALGKSAAEHSGGGNPAHRTQLMGGGSDWRVEKISPDSVQRGEFRDWFQSRVGWGNEQLLQRKAAAAQGRASGACALGPSGPNKASSEAWPGIRARHGHARATANLRHTH